MTDSSTAPAHSRKNLGTEGDGKQHVTYKAGSSSLAPFHANAELLYSTSEDSICARCRDLDRISLSGPPFSIVIPTIQGHDLFRSDIRSTLHEFMRDSLQPNCTICKQILKLLNIHGIRPDRLRIWWNSYRASPGGHYVHSCRIDAPSRYHEEFELVPIAAISDSSHRDHEEPPGPDYNGVKSWLRFCRNNHSMCAASRSQNTTSLRVIDCQSRLLTTIAPTCPYVALSYVWGYKEPDSPPSQLQLPAALPKTIEDAMEVTLKLGVGYLWVDRYCINQTDEEEKNRLFSMMDVIYRNANITIIAAAGETPEEGLPGVTTNSRVPHQKVQIGVHSLSAVPSYRRELTRSKWHTRGWTYQEGRLSRRQLVFLPSQIYFQCASHVFAEGLHPRTSRSTLQVPWHGSDAYRTLALFHRPSPKSLPWSLRTDIQTYYEKQLSFHKDTLHAFQGVVNSYRHHEQLDGSLAHFWGLNLFVLKHLDAHGAFVAELLWYVVSRSGYLVLAPAQPEKRGEDEEERGEDFPSWSWAAKMAGDMGDGKSSLRYKDRDGRDVYDSTTRRAHSDGMAISFTHRSGAKVTVEEYMLQGDGYLSFYPWFDITCWSIWGSIRTGAPLDRYEPFREEDIDGLEYEELDLDFSCEWARGEGSVLVVFLGAWECVDQETEGGVDGSVHEKHTAATYDGDERSAAMYSDIHCLLTEQVRPGTFRRIGLWSVGVERRNGAAGTKGLLDRLLNMWVLQSNEQWEMRNIRLV